MWISSLESNRLRSINTNLQATKNVNSPINRVLDLSGRIRFHREGILSYIATATLISRPFLTIECIKTQSLLTFQASSLTFHGSMGTFSANFSDWFLYQVQSDVSNTFLIPATFTLIRLEPSIDSLSATLINLYISYAFHWISPAFTDIAAHLRTWGL